MSEISYLEPEHIIQKYLNEGTAYFDNKVMRPGWYGFYEPEVRQVNAEIPGSTCHHYDYNKHAAPINFVILDSNIIGVGQEAFKDRKDLLVFDAKSSDGLVLEKNVFSGCINLHKISLPYEIKSIDKTALYGCHGLLWAEITRGEFNGKEIPRERRNGFVPIKYRVLTINGFPYLFDSNDVDSDMYNGKGPRKDVFFVQKLVVKDGKWSKKILCARGRTSFSPYFNVYGLGNTEEMAKKNLKNEMDIIDTAVHALRKSKNISEKQIMQALQAFNKKQCY